MKVLITGATGYVGASLAKVLVGRGDQVIGLVRNEDRAKALPAGVEPLVGDLGSTDWFPALAGVDALAHTAFPLHGLDHGEGVPIEARFLRDAAAALEGTGKALIATNGTLFLGDSGERRLDETATIVPHHPAAARAYATQAVATAKGVRGVELRFASFVYGHGAGGFLPLLVSHARRMGRAVFVGDGEIATSAVHVDAAAGALVDALDGNAAGTFHIASDEEPTFRQVAAAIALGVGRECRVESITQDAAAAQLDPFTAMFLATNNRLDAGRARRELGWSHAGHVPLLWDAAGGSYAR